MVNEHIFFLQHSPKAMKGNRYWTYKWTSLGNLESSGGIWPLIELLFMWLRYKNYNVNLRARSTEEKTKVKKVMFQCDSGLSLGSHSQVLDVGQIRKWFRNWSRYKIYVQLKFRYAREITKLIWQRPWYFISTQKPEMKNRIISTGFLTSLMKTVGQVCIC